MNNEHPNFFLKNPWADLPKDDLHKTTVSIARSVYADIIKVHSKQGVLQATFYQLLTKLTDELKRNGLTEYDPAGYELAVANCTITLGLGKRSTVGEPAAGRQHDGTEQAPQRNDGPGTPRLAQPNAGLPDAPDASKPRGKRGRKGQRAEAGEKTV